MRKVLYTLSLEKLRQNTKEILENYELFVHGHTHYFTKSFCKNVQKMATS